MKVSARYTGIGADYTDTNMLAFTVVIDDPCATEVRTIDPSILPIPLTYTLYDPPLQLILDLSKITPHVPNCPDFIIEFKTIADDPLDPAVWNTTEPGIDLRTETSDLSKVGLYSLRMYARLDGDPSYYVNQAVLDFNMQIIDPCTGVSFAINTAILSSLDIEYTIG